jgi:hypothetical protein
VLLGNGDGTFGTVKIYSSGGVSPISLASADVNGDGKPDIVIVNCGPEGNAGCNAFVNGVVGVLLGNGDETFQTATKYDTGGPNALSMAVGDLRGIGSSNVVTSNWFSLTANNVSVLLNNIPVCTSSPAITLSVNPNLLWPPNGNWSQ